jgi:hypothetical protein
MYSTLSNPSTINDSRQKAILIPQTIATLLLKYNLSPNTCKLTATINSNGTVSNTAPPGIPSSFYSKYYTEMGKSIQDLLKPTNNTYSAFKPALSRSQVMINRVPIYPLPDDPCKLKVMISDLIRLDTDVQVEDVRRLNPNSTKPMTSLVVTVAPGDIEKLIKKGILLFNQTRQCNTIWNASFATQCTLYWQFGYPAVGCKKDELHPTRCRICISTDHTAQNHPCLTNCPPRDRKRGFCSYMVAICLNYAGNHPANDPQCPSRVHAIQSLHERHNPSTIST